MNRIIILSFFLTIGFSLQAQIEINKMERLLLDKSDSIGVPAYNAYLNLSGDFYTNSNSITNTFINALAYQRTFIYEKDKDRESNRLKKNNRLGADAYASIQGVYITPKINYVFGFGQRVFANSRFPKDLFELVFRGNSSYAGEEANLSKTTFRYFDYQNIYFGFQKQFNNGKTTIGASASYIRGGRLISLEMNNTSLFTQEYGQYIDLNGDVNFTKTNGKKPGSGAGLNLFYSVKQKNNNRLNFEVRDIGFITWKNTKTYGGDASFRYDGLLVNDILDSVSTIITSLSIDSIADKAGISISSGSSTILLPTIFHVNYVISPNKKFSRTIGLKYMATKGFIPEVYLREADFLGKGFTLVNTFSYGGFGRLDYELGIMKKIKNSFIISANVFAFEYLILPGKSSGNGFNFGLTKIF